MKIDITPLVTTFGFVGIFLFSSFLERIRTSGIGIDLERIFVEEISARLAGDFSINSFDYVRGKGKVDEVRGDFASRVHRILYSTPFRRRIYET